MKKTTLAQMFVAAAVVACVASQSFFGTVGFASTGTAGTSSNTTSSAKTAHKDPIPSPQIPDTPTPPNNVSLGSGTVPSTPTQDTTVNPSDKTPTIVEAAIVGDFDYGSTGISYFQNIRIYLVANNLNDDHFLSPEGLHWSEKTEVQLIKGRVLGSFNLSNFSAVKPGSTAQAFRMEPGDTGRITHVGKTKSGIELDLIWEVVASDKDEWRANSGFQMTSTQGLAFVGAQSFEKEASNSICVLYDTASNLALHYRIVKHATTQEMPVVVSFISTDIDSAQGVETDLANIVELIPKESGLAKKDNIIYDTSAGAKNLNGAQDLPRAGYVGASFTSNFTYVFYSPAPERVNNSYFYPRAVRYDIFGSSLQAKLLPKIQNHITIRYISTKGKELKSSEHWQGFTDESYNFKALLIEKHQLVDIKKDDTDPNHPSISFIYAPLHKLTFSFVDEEGELLDDAKSYEVVEGQDVSFVPPKKRGYITPESFKQTIEKDTTHSFIYKKRPPHIPDDTEEDPTPEPNKPSAGITAPATPSGKTTTSKPKKKTAANQKKTQGRKPQNRAPKKSTSTPQKSVPQAPSAKPVEPRDPFLVNTGMSKEQKKLFLEYIAEVTRQAKKKYGTDQEKINHAIANAIAYPVYATDKNQNRVNDFGDEPKVRSYKSINKFLPKVHEDKKYHVDFPHFATSLASSYTSSFPKEATKFFAGLSPGIFRGISPKDNFLQLNSLTGDLLTHIDEKDRNADIDFLIFHYHPTYKNMRLDEAIRKYYHKENLVLEREKLYREVLALQAGSKSVDKQYALNILSAGLSIGGLALIYKTWKEQEEKRKQQEALKAQTSAQGTKTQPVLGKLTLNLSWSNNPLDILGVGILNPIGRAIGTAINTAGKVVLDYVVKPVANITVVPLVKHVVAPVYNHVVKPAIKAVGKAVVKLAVPVLKKVAKPVVAVAKAVVEAGKYIYNSFIKPKGKNGRIKPNRNKLLEKGKRRSRTARKKAGKPFVDKVIKPFVKPIYRRVIKPVVNAAKAAYNKYVKPVVNFVRDKVIAPIGNFLKGLWG